jgi:hypothetical protein
MFEVGHNRRLGFPEGHEHLGMIERPMACVARRFVVLLVVILEL